jgi:hypothetical protein
VSKPRLAPANPVLSIDSNWESASKKWYAFRSKHLYPYFKRKKLKVTNLHNQMAVRRVFKSEAVLAGTRLITGMGHGEYDAFTGHLGEVILKVGDYDPLEVKNKIVHLLSCKTAKLLGPDLVKNGARAFFGYSEDLLFDVKYQDVYFECASEVDRALADGEDATGVHARTEARFRRGIDTLTETNGQAASLLRAALGYLCSPTVHKRFGDPAARL